MQSLYKKGMQTFIALLRAVNVGGTGKLPMADLRAIAEAEGFTNVRTYIQSGNLVFSSPDQITAAKRKLEKRLEEYAGKPVGAFLRTTHDLQELLTANPFSDKDPSQVGVLFLDRSPPSDILGSVKGKADEQIEPAHKEVYIHFPSGMGRSKLSLPAMSEGTMRNMNTVNKLVQLALET